jgi:hypothetical protein
VPTANCLVSGLFMSSIVRMTCSHYAGSPTGGKPGKGAEMGGFAVVGISGISLLPYKGSKALRRLLHCEQTVRGANH